MQDTNKQHRVFHSLQLLHRRWRATSKLQNNYNPTTTGNNSANKLYKRVWDYVHVRYMHWHAHTT